MEIIENEFNGTIAIETSRVFSRSTAKRKALTVSAPLTLNEDNSFKVKKKKLANMVPITNKAVTVITSRQNVFPNPIINDSVQKSDIVKTVDWSEWKKSGRQVMLNNVKSLLRWQKRMKKKLEMRDKQNITKIGRRELQRRKLGPMKQVFDIFSHWLEDKLNIEDVIDSCRLLIRLDKSMCATITDVLTIFDCQSSIAEDLELRMLVGKLSKGLEHVLSREILLERLDMDSLLEFNLVPSKQFNSRAVKIKTKLFYKQKKFNLFREESEGYSKVLVELSKASLISHKPDHLLQNLKSLIGYFNLDPNRVLDAVLNAFELRPEEQSLFSSLVRLYVRDKERLAEVIGFRFASYHKRGPSTPKSLYIVTALLVQEGILSLDDVLVWLQPDEGEISAEIEERCKIPDKKQMEKGSPGSPMKIVKSAAAASNLLQKYLKNQKLVLCETFLELGDWENFKTIMKKIGPRYVTSYPPIALSLCKLIHYLIDPIYIRHFKFGSKIPRAKVKFNVTPQTPEQVHTFAELKSVFQMFYALKSALGYDPVLVFKITRILSAGVELIEDLDNQDLDEKTIYYDGISLLDEVLLPALACVNNPCCVAEAIWKLLKFYPFPTRFALYGRWKSCAEKSQLIAERKHVGEYNVKIGMKRVSKENVKQVGRLFGKATHFCPPALFHYILNMVSMYDSLIGPVVESLRYLNGISCDALGYCILDFFIKEKTKKTLTDGHSLAQWFQNLALFSALAHKKLSIDVAATINYVSQELVEHHCLELLLLKELLLKVTGIEINDELPSHQYGVTGEGELHKMTEAIHFARNFKRSSIRLRDALSKLKQTAPLAIMLAQERNNIAHSLNEEIHIKLLGRLYDECHSVLLQFGTFLYTPVMISELKDFPSLDELLYTYNLELDTAFFLIKPGIYKNITETCLSLKQEKSKANANMFSVLNDIIKPLGEVVRKSQPAKVWDEVSPSFVVLFWILNLIDVHPSSQSPTPPSGLVGDQGNHGKGKSGLGTTISDKVFANFSNLEAALNEQKDTWFVPGPQRPGKNDVITSFLQLCVLRRCIFSPSDASYCARFIQLLHKFRTENFSTLLCYDRLLCDITYMATSCTENEATRYGHFLLAMLQDVMRWHSSKDIYDKECAYTPGFVTKFRGSIDGAANDNILYENYRHVCHKWHFKLTKSLMTLLESKDYVQIRNGMIILIKLLPQFPVISRLAQCIEKGINKVKEEEKNVRQDLYTLAVSYSGQLNAKMRTMIKESDFHKVPNQSSATSSTQSSNSTEAVENHSSITIQSEGNSKSERPGAKIKKGSRSSTERSDDGKSMTKIKEKDGKGKIKEKDSGKPLALEENSGGEGRKRGGGNDLLEGKGVSLMKKEETPSEQVEGNKEKSSSKEKDIKNKHKEGEKKEKETVDKEKKDKEQKEKREAQKEKDKKEKEKKEKERESKERELKEREKKEKEEREKRESKEREAKEKEWKEKELKERLEKEMKERERKEKEQQQKDKDKKEKEVKEKDRKPKKEREKKEKEHSKEKERKEKDNKDRDRKESSLTVTVRGNKEKDKKEKERGKDNGEKELGGSRGGRKEGTTSGNNRSGSGIGKERKETSKEKKEGQGNGSKERKETMKKEKSGGKDKKEGKKEKKEGGGSGGGDAGLGKVSTGGSGGGTRNSPMHLSSSSEGYESPSRDRDGDEKREFYMSVKDRVYKREPLAKSKSGESYFEEEYSDDNLSHESWYEPHPLSKDDSPQLLKRSVSNRSYYSKSSNDGVAPTETKRRKVESGTASKVTLVPKFLERQIGHEKKAKRPGGGEGQARKEREGKRFTSSSKERTPADRERSKSYTSDSWKKWR